MTALPIQRLATGKKCDCKTIFGGEELGGLDCNAQRRGTALNTPFRTQNHPVKACRTLRQGFPLETPLQSAPGASYGDVSRGIYPQISVIRGSFPGINGKTPDDDIGINGKIFGRFLGINGKT